MSQPLAGLKVVSLEQAVAAPLCTRRLALAGAEVFKIERPEGDFARGYDSAVHGESSYFVWLNAGKKSVVLDLQSDEGKSRLGRLLRVTDVLVQNLKPGALGKLGIDLDVVHRENPKFISASISGFHPDTSQADRKAYDLLMQAESGLASITGSVHEAGRVGVSIVDAATGMFAYEAILEALLVRGQQGRGARLNIALFDAVAELMTVPYLLERYGGEAPQRVGLAHPGICPYGVFTSSDSVDFVLSIQNEREWRRLAEALELLNLLDDARCVDNETRVQNRRFVDATVQLAFGVKSWQQLMTCMDQADLAFAPVNTLAVLKQHPGLRTYSVAVGSARVELPRVPGLVTDASMSIPSLGEHTEEVLTWLESAADQ